MPGRMSFAVAAFPRDVVIPGRSASADGGESVARASGAWASGTRDGGTDSRARAAGTRITLEHTGFDSRDACASVGDGWETAFARLGERLRG